MLAILFVSLCAVSSALNCDFENGVCGWKNSQSDMPWRVDWIPQKGRAGGKTGPKGDHTSGNGYYLIMKGRKDKDASLIKNGFIGNKCLTFWYHINGKKVGEVEVWVDDTLKLSIKGSRGKVWKRAQVKINGKRQVEFYAVRGRARKGVIAIDDIKFTDTCGPSPTTDKPRPSTAHPTPPLPNTPPVPGGPCGMKGKTRIVGGSAAEENEWPWQALLMDNDKNQFCGGSLIDPQWVLTAAHCMDGETQNSVQVRLGAHKRKDKKPNGKVQDFNVVRIIKHKNYNKNTQSHDVALLKLARKAKLTRDVNLVCLPESVPDPDQGQKCWTTGWGTVSSGGPQPDVLHEVDVPAVSQDVCNKAYKGRIDKTMICAGLKQGGKDACQGDSGGPFVCGKRDGNTERFYLHGVTSWGNGCADKDAYGVYARVSVFTKWIREGMGKLQKPKPTIAPSISIPQAPASAFPPSGACGKGPTSRIVGGSEAIHGDYPWQALLQTAGNLRGQFCGGTLVHKQWVVTAAHCVEGQQARDIIVRMGAHDRVESSPANQEEQKFKLLKIIKHPSYHKPIQMSHDVALLKLERPATLDSYTNPACLPSTDAAVGDKCVITGWGTLKSGGKPPDKLQVATVPVVSQSNCKEAYRNAIHASMLCAGFPGGKVDSCQGDSGGPLVCKDANGRYSLHGVTSWGWGCAKPRRYGVYARVKYLLSWISNEIKSN